ncbi:TRANSCRIPTION FACTOR BHLH121 [Salix viminalis]|uniref:TRANSCRIPTION FACTOR BHLH121 n=1 Tax=Salix viminalis TaxID=40686 RepID=A0A9Q0QK53_SALVM|nr:TRANSCRIPTION FACTOR BHLH121 [Salix viminalis]
MARQRETKTTTPWNSGGVTSRPLAPAPTPNPDPDRPRNDKGTILADTIQLLKDLTSQVDKLKAEYATLSEESLELTQEKNDLREEKASLKLDIDNLNIQCQQRLRAPYPMACYESLGYDGPTFWECKIEKSEDSDDVSTDLELKTPGSTADQDLSPGQRKSKKSQRKESSVTEWSSSSRCSSSPSVQDSSHNSVVGGTKHDDLDS